METTRLTLLFSDPLLASALERAAAPEESLTLMPWPSAIEDLTPIITAHPPDVLVLQGAGAIRVPPHEIAGLIKATRPRVQVVVLMERWSEETLLSALEAGADAVLSYRAGVEQLRTAIQAVRDGESYLSPDLAHLLVTWLQRRPLRHRQRRHLMSTLNSQQLQILAALAAGKRDREIAEALFLSPKTVRNNVSIILQRLNVRDRSEAAVYAIAAGLTDMREAELLLHQS
jgi:DNA-binding NarL/FixJ family response regulator